MFIVQLFDSFLLGLCGLSQISPQSCVSSVYTCVVCLGNTGVALWLHTIGAASYHQSDDLYVCVSS